MTTISIHSSTQELTLSAVLYVKRLVISIHSSTQELTLDFVTGRSDRLYFNSQLHAGADGNQAAQDRFSQISIHSSTQELTDKTLPVKT